VTDGTRERFLDASARLFRRQGYAGTGLKLITAESGAPWGSLYHHFPGGKEELGVATITRSGRRYEKVLHNLAAEATDTAQIIEDYFQLSVEALAASDYADGCPVATVALEAASTNEALRHCCAEVFASWQLALAERLEADGLAPDAAAELAVFALATFEGAVMLSRTARDPGPLRVSARLTARAIRTAIATSR